MTRHLVHSTFGTFGITVVRNILFILPMVFFIRPFVRLIYLYAGARLFVFSRNFASGARKTATGGVGAAWWGWRLLLLPPPLWRWRDGGRD